MTEYLKRPDWNGEEADKLAVGIEPIRYIKDGKKITHIEKLSNYYRKILKSIRQMQQLKGLAKNIVKRMENLIGWEYSNVV